MLTYVDKIKEIASVSADIYSLKMLNTLQSQIVKLKSSLAEIVDTHATEDKYSLIVSNDSSSNIKLYELVDRVKSSKSLEEKIIRNQEFFSLEPVKTNEKELIEKIYKLNDDLMGLRFLVSLSCDCNSMYNLITDYKDEFEKKGIEFLDLTPNPQIMQNGRQIYRIKGKYNKEYPFELQIKSKVDSAWADIEHMLFYKDYQFSYIQNTNKEVMNKLGNLLDKVDDLMIQIRESQKSYEYEKKEMEFTAHLGSQFKDFLIEKVGSSFILNDYRKPLYNLFSTFSDPEQQIISRSTSHPLAWFEFPNPKVTDPFLSNYNKMKEVSLELVIFEHIYSTWINDLGWHKSFDKVVKYVEYFTSLLKCIIDYNIDDYKDIYHINDDCANDFSIWASSLIANSLKTNKTLHYRPKLFIYSAAKLIMLYSYYFASKHFQSNHGESTMIDDEKEKTVTALIKRIDNEIVSFLFDNDNKHAQAIVDIQLEEEMQYISPSFLEKMKNTYGIDKKTKSGKNMPNNILERIIGQVLTLDATK